MKIELNRITFKNEKVKEVVDKIINENGKFIIVDDMYLSEECISDAICIVTKENNEYYPIVEKEGEYIDFDFTYSPLFITEYDLPIDSIK